MCRTKRTLLSGICAPLRQRTSGKKSWPDGTAVAGQQFEYSAAAVGPGAPKSSLTHPRDRRYLSRGRWPGGSVERCEVGRTWPG